MSMVPTLRETAVTTVPAPCQGSLVTEAHEFMLQSKCLVACMDQAGLDDEKMKWPGSKGSVGLQRPALGRNDFLSRRAGVGGSGDQGVLANTGNM